MNKNDLIDIIFKAAAIFFLVLAVITFPSVIGALINILLLARSVLENIAGVASLGASVMSASISTSIEGVLKFILYIFFARNLYSGGSWFKWVLCKSEAKKQ